MTMAPVDAGVVEPARIDPDEYRRVLGHYPTGVSVIAARRPDGGLSGMAVGTFSAVSLDPPMVAFMPGRSSTSWPGIEAAGRFSVNVLADDQQGLCAQFSAKGEDKFAGVDHVISAHGVPVIRDCAATIECDIAQVIEAGDHFIVLGRVLALDCAPDRAPLLFLQRDYGRFGPLTDRKGENADG